MYTEKNFRTKKELKEALKNGEVIRIQAGGLFDTDSSKISGTVYLEGPHYPAPHTWYAQGKAKNGVLLSVK